MMNFSKIRSTLTALTAAAGLSACGTTQYGSGYPGPVSSYGYGAGYGGPTPDLRAASFSPGLTPEYREKLQDYQEKLAYEQARRALRDQYRYSGYGYGSSRGRPIVDPNYVLRSASRTMQREISRDINRAIRDAFR